ncbi:hypothetical protein ACIOEX_16135 [Streptomyces sp. NPDC087850]|uniref:hypothetical protein n=1 Tax=Streptomyces sp. NPDC087850 TaxID=3365809 RepID=UPI0038063B25
MNSLVINDGAYLDAFDAPLRLNVRVPALRGKTAASVTGTARVFAASAFGSVTDFGFTPYNTLADTSRTPLMDPVTLMVAATGTQDANNGWSKAYVTSTVPQGRNIGALGSTYRGARYAEVRVRMPALAQGVAPQINSIMIERQQALNLLSHDAAYQLRSCCYTGAACDVALSGDRFVVGSRSLKCTVTDTSTTSWIGPVSTFAALAPIKPSSPTLVFSASVATAAAERFVLKASFYDAARSLISSQDSPILVTRGNYEWAAKSFTHRPPVSAVYASVVPCLQPSSSLSLGTEFFVDALGIRYQSLRSVTPAVPGYRAARHMYIDLKANRVNLARNPSVTDNDPVCWLSHTPGTASTPALVRSYTGRTRPGAAEYASTLSVAKTVYPEGTRIGLGSNVSKQATGTPLEIVNLGRRHILSAYISEQAANTVPVRAFVEITEDVPGKGLVRTVYRGESTAEVREQHPERVEGSWTRISVPFTPPAGTSRWVSAWFGPDPEQYQGTVTSSFFLDDILLEEGSTLLPYFDGGGHHPDYLWEEWDATEHSRSHLYRERRTLQRRLKEVIGDHIEHGTPYDLRYASAPKPAQQDPLPLQPSIEFPPLAVVAGVAGDDIGSQSAVIRWASHQDPGRSIIVRRQDQEDLVCSPAAGAVLVRALTAGEHYRFDVLCRDDASGRESAETSVRIITPAENWSTGLVNEAIDPSFEYSQKDTAGRPAGAWTINRNVAAPGAALEYDASMALVGGRSMRMTGLSEGTATDTQAISMWYGRLACTPGETWSLSGWVRTDRQRAVQARIRFWDSTTNTEVTSSGTSALTVAANTWTKVSVSVAVPAGANQTWGQFTCQTMPGGEVFWADGAMFTRSAAPVEYADGDTGGWEWVGGTPGGASVHS